MQKLPLCVDCDGTLVYTDLLLEGMLRIVKANPWCLFLIPYWLLSKGKAHLKVQVAARSTIEADSLPYNMNFVDYLRTQHDSGRQIVLVTGAPSLFATAVAQHLGLFSETHATTEGCNLTGVRKRDFLCNRFGKSQFEYAGNEREDLAIWRSAAAAIVVNARHSVAAAIPSDVPVTQVFEPRRASLRIYLRALRVHQWLKNLLIFVPAAVSHRIMEPQTLTLAALAVGCFCLCASSVYVVNDLLDLDSDRRHPRKRFRPFAAGRLSIPQGILLAFGGLLGAIIIAALLLPPSFLLILGGYMVASMLYSLALKTRAIVDVLVLAALYTMRLIAGSAATGILPSFWLLAFAMFLFLSLAVVKRYAELQVMAADGRENLRGRAYVAADLPLLNALGMSSGLIAVLVMALYVNAPEVSQLYPFKEILWLMPPLMLYWICRVWFKTHRGQMHDDPIVFATMDRPSLATGACLTIVLILAALLGK